jgi:putative transposase
VAERGPWPKAARTPHEALYPLVFVDALRAEIRDEGMVRNKAVHVALGVRIDGQKEIPGLWIEQTASRACWPCPLQGSDRRPAGLAWWQIPTAGHERAEKPGVEDILIAVVDGLKGFPDAITAVFPAGPGPDLHRAPQPPFARFRVRRGRPGVAAELKTIYRAKDADAGKAALEAFDGAGNIPPSPSPCSGTGRR